jgi:hypothetical protein
VYAHLDRLEAEVCAPAGIPLLRVTAGNIRRDALDPEHRFASMPLYVANRDGRAGMIRRQCTREYKLAPLLAKIRELLGAPVDGQSHRVGRVPVGVWAEQLVGISVDEAHRALDSRSTRYAAAAWPLLDLGLSRADCRAINAAAGYEAVAKSACIGCPFHSNAHWRAMRDQQPGEWADAVAFDAAIRGGSARATHTGHALLGQAYLHRSRRPLDQAPIDHVTAAEHAAAQIDGLDLLSADHVTTAWTTQAPIHGCGPHTCTRPTPTTRGGLR